jgi:hypothetical protein
MRITREEEEGEENDGKEGGDKDSGLEAFVREKKKPVAISSTSSQNEKK